MGTEGERTEPGKALLLFQGGQSSYNVERHRLAVDCDWAMDGRIKRGFNWYYGRESHSEHNGHVCEMVDLKW
jgi:hypothetical protein